MIDLHSPVEKETNLFSYKNISYCMVQTHKICGLAQTIKYQNSFHMLSAVESWVSGSDLD